MRKKPIPKPYLGINGALKLADGSGAMEPQLMDYSGPLGLDRSMPTVIEFGFDSSVESRLPYHFITRPQFVPKYQDWLIDGTHIIDKRAAG
ncbi:unnamed protein product [Rhizoctonia solani]|uniref:Uncharacterized protein n=1 Tax=Rhizoctonia solani TaxID=456999 RepID=A0A8H2WAM6_9AGAM|nr:unnamed protein product [Rhizoctonia solani]